MMDMHHVHVLKHLLRFAGVFQGQMKARIGQWQPRAADDAFLVVHLVRLTEGEHVNIVSGLFEIAFVQIDVIGNAANVRLVSVCHHSDAHGTAFRLNPTVWTGRCQVQYQVELSSLRCYG